MQALAAAIDQTRAEVEEIKVHVGTGRDETNTSRERLGNLTDNVLKTSNKVEEQGPRQERGKRSISEFKAVAHVGTFQG